MEIVPIALAPAAFVLLLAVIEGTGTRPRSTGSRPCAGGQACSALTW
jgi:hypothetical protein